MAGLLAVVALATTWLAPGSPTVPAAAAADPSSDIPGVPLPGPVAAGRLGGVIYDVVYSFSVKPGYVIVASLTGTPGTDFDLYLFDATATTVLSNIGLLTKSAGPTSSESISWPSRLGGTYYIDLNGATDIEGDYRLTLQTLPDPTPPVASMILANGQQATNQLVVPVALTASDDLSGVTEMAFSSDGVTFEDWQVFQTSTTWNFTAGDGRRHLWVKVKSGVGLDSPPATASVIIDTAAPRVIDFDPAPGSSVSGLRPRLTVTFNEPIDPVSWTDLGLIVQSASGALVAGAYSYDVASRIGSYIPSLAFQAGALYVVTVGDVKDIAGNRVLSPGSWSITPLAPTSLNAVADSSVISRGGSARIGVSIDGAPAPSAIDVLAASDPSQGFVGVTTITLANGEGLLLVTPTQNTTYRFRYGGAFGVSPVQVDVPILVRRSVALVGRSSSIVSRTRVGASIKLTAAVGPATSGVSVSFRLYRFDTARRVWVYAGSHGRNTDSTGRATNSWSPTAPGSYYWRASVASTVDFANNVSPVYRFSVSR